MKTFPRTAMMTALAVVLTFLVGTGAGADAASAAPTLDLATEPGSCADVLVITARGSGESYDKTLTSTV